MMRPRSSLLAPLLYVVALACAPTPDVTGDATLEANKALVARFIEATNAADWDALADIMADDLRRHSAATEGPPVRSRDEFVALQKTFLVSFPDQRAIVEAIVAEGDLVAVRATYTGTHAGPLGDIPATGRSVAAPFLGMLRIADGRIVEMWVEWDNVAMMKQLGLFPPPGPPPGDG